MAALIIYLLFGVLLARRVLPGYRTVHQIWLGLVFGCIALMWLPCLPAFFLGYTTAAVYGALGVVTVAVIVLLVFDIRGIFTTQTVSGQHDAVRETAFTLHDGIGLVLALIATVFCAYILHTHVLWSDADGNLWVGQSTYGDLAMHLGFVESIYRQGMFPPDYSICPGVQLNYPFLVDAASSGLRFFGLSLRMSVIWPSIVMLFCVFWGFWHLADHLLKRTAPTILSWLLFVCNGGFGFFYFFGKYDFSEIFTGYYTTPTNLVDQNIRWVNVICDMLIPQRTTMAGWCVVLAAIFLLIIGIEKTLHGAGRREFLTLAIVAGAMPMIHTHSFLALGILSAAWFFCTLPAAIRGRQAKRLVGNYVLYGLICLALAVPQLMKWTMDSVGTGNMLQWNLGWVAENENWLWFFIKNCGIVFLLMWVVMFFLRGEQLGLFIGAAAIFVLANIVAFQPNLYDNNKLLYIWYMLTDILVCGELWRWLEKFRAPAARAGLTAAVLFLGCFSGVLSMGREAVSRYQLLSDEQVAAADFIVENTPADSVFLTSTSHTNPVCVLAGRNIVCGSSLYLYFHGVDYQWRENDVYLMYEGGDTFEELADEFGVDYVYIGGNEYGEYNVNYDYFAANYPLIYQQDGISIFRITDN